MLMINIPAEMLAAQPTGSQQKMNDAYQAFNEKLVSRNALVEGDALLPPSTATTVQVRDGKTLTTDGPFAETKEQLGGYYIVEAKDLDEAIEFAAGIPSATMGSIEVRPVMVFE
jgi:hypothetical protein